MLSSEFYIHQSPRYLQTIINSENFKTETFPDLFDNRLEFYRIFRRNEKHGSKRTFHTPSFPKTKVYLNRIIPTEFNYLHTEPIRLLLRNKARDSVSKVPATVAYTDKIFIIRIKVGRKAKKGFLCDALGDRGVA